MNKSDLIARAVNAGRAVDILLLLEGESAYTSEDFEGAPADRELAKLWTIAQYHLRFVSEFGNRVDTIMKDGKWVSAFPDEFAQWLNVGAPGIAISELNRYLHDHPLLSCPNDQ
ncbi:hypothetical protein [Pseudoduganella sp. R-43]|uniref:hypothetical protein n=1 Tax=unclassified Pseudoduganella TaxID=2637179 RepID=UPI003CFA0D82